MPGKDSSSEPCVLRRGDRIDARDPRLENCKFEDGSIIVFQYGDDSTTKPTTKTNMPADALKPTAFPSAEVPVAAPAPAFSSLVPAAPAPTASSVAVQTSASDELSKILPANGQLSGLTVVLAAIAVLGGGAAWKFYSQRSKEKHEQKMKELENGGGQSQEQHPSCKSQNAQVEAELRKLNEQMGTTSSGLADVSKRVGDLENKIGAPGLGDDLSELETRITKIEKTLPKPAKRRTK